MLHLDPHDREKLVDPLFRTGWRFWIAVAVLLTVIAAGVVMYIEQLELGLGQTGMQRPVYWGLYMTNFVFFIGISLAGTLISAVLNLIGAEWRRPITRVAEAITVFALIIATLQIMIDMGRPDRLLNVVLYGRLQSPILWDVIVVVAYLLSSATYLFLPLIPDIAILRDNLPGKAPAWRRLLYRALAFGWRGNVEQWRRLEKSISVMTLLIIPIAVSVHTITSWILATTVQPGWHSTVFGPYFVVTAIFSGIAALFVAMTIARWTLGLEDYIQLRHYRNLGFLFMVMAIVWGYFTYTEFLVLVAGQESDEFPVLASKLWGNDSGTFWLMLGLIATAIGIMVVPRLIPASKATVLRPRYALASLMTGGLLVTVNASADSPDIHILGWILVILTVLFAGLGIGAWLKQHPISATCIAGAAVVLGTWLERWNIVVPTLTHPRLIAYSTYTPSVTEIVLTSASVALFVLMIVIFFKLFPAVSLWEVAEGRAVEAARKRVTIPSPEPSESSRRKRLWRFR